MTDTIPIVFIPGILQSQLYLPETGKKLWMSPSFLKYPEKMEISSKLEIKNNDLDQQTLTPITREGGMLKQNIILIEKLVNAFPDRPVYYFSYDFRQACDVTADTFEEYISRQGFPKIDIVCHSMGGIVTASYVAKYGMEHIRKIICLGVPFEGSPLISKLVITGDIRSIPSAVAETFGLSREMLLAYPAVADLLPTKEYFAAYPMLREGVPLSIPDTKKYFRNLIAATFADSRKRQKLLHEKAYPLLRTYPDCYFAVGTGKSTIRTISIQAEETTIEELSDYSGDTEVPGYSATMCGKLESLGYNRFITFDARHGELTKASEPTSWVIEKLT